MRTSGGDVFAEVRAALEPMGFEVEEHTQWHLTATRDDLHLNCWRNKRGALKWMAFARVWTGSLAEVVNAIEDGRIEMPDEFPTVECFECGEEVWLAKTDSGKRVTLDADGDMHFKNCGMS